MTPKILQPFNHLTYKVYYYDSLGIRLINYHIDYGYQVEYQLGESRKNTHECIFKLKEGKEIADGLSQDLANQVKINKKNKPLYLLLGLGLSSITSIGIALLLK